MKVIENIHPFKLSNLVDKIVVNYTIAIPPTGEESTIYLVAPNNFNRDTTEKGLQLLVDFGYIKNFSNILYLPNIKKYKEEGFHSPIFVNDFGKDVGRKIRYKIYLHQDRKKWDFLQSQRLNPDIPLDIDEDKVNKMIIGYSSGNKGIIGTINSLKVEYSQYFSSKKDIGIDEIQDFLYFFASKYKNEFYKISIIDFDGIDFNVENGDVFLNGELIANISFGTKEYNFFKCLYENQGKPISHSAIFSALSGDEKKEKTAQSYCSDIKRKIPKEARNLIESSKGHYRLP